MNNNQPTPEDESLQAPRALVEGLKQLPVRKVIVPPAVDTAILRAAREHLHASPKVVPVSFVRRQPWLAIAASVILLGAIIFLTIPSKVPKQPASQFAREDLNQDGQVDILDALTLSLQIQKNADSTKLDINGDGTVNQFDVDGIAKQSVQLAGGKG